MHDSAVRPPEPSCHPGTRNAILERLDKWSFEQPEDSAIFWLNGCAGIGKSAIAQQFAASCQARGQLGGSFFWKRGDARRGHWRSLFPTLAYQLAVSFPDIGAMIQRAVAIDRLIASKSMRHQLEKLIGLPFREAPMLALRPILVLDGLDECEDHAIQTMLLRLLIDVVRSGRVPIRVLICSRSEAYLREVLEASENSDVCGGFQIRPDVSAYADISRFLTHEFSRIHRAHTGREIPLDNEWPGKATIRELVERSSGTFIYAATIARYVDDEYSHPDDRLGAVLSLDPSSTTPLDDLYTQILSAVPNKPTLLRVLHAVVEAVDLDPEQIDMGLRMRRGTSRITLRGLHSLLQVPPVRIFEHRITPVKLLHASFRDFLVDPQRSSGFGVLSGEELQIALVHGMVCALESGLQPVDFRTITQCFVQSLVKIPPKENLLPILHNLHLQHEIYNKYSRAEPGSIVVWLQRFSPPPRDLVRTWADLRHLRNGDKLPSIRLRSDHILTVVLSKDPALLSFLRTMTSAVAKDVHLSDAKALDLLGLKWDVLRTLLEHPFILNDVRQFLCNPQRCGALYMSEEETARFIALRCISRMNEILHTADFFQFMINTAWIPAMCSCEPDAGVFSALEHLDLSQFCGRLEPDEKYHLECHSDFLRPASFDMILDWLWRWPSTPLHLIQSWERQRSAVENCYARLLRPANSECGVIMD
ncbi:hypothetical protein FB45DRAFT_789526 [Roridomyces roridus]|uniref:Nephrocystin 3-like N-terminal domain-containing protein n=1 Tax=Roridomyces roridus TaxID=1738132 RepID=A0AAD7BYL0_9AGAR|nr:hypothetical protein FB45DRAFT_789526 [Roridomyces roridus]